MTLRGISLTCRTNFSIYHPILLTNVTLTWEHIVSFHQSLQRNGQSGKLIKTLTYEKGSHYEGPFKKEDGLAFGLSFLSESEYYSKDKLVLLCERMEKKMYEIFSKTENLESLIINDAALLAEFQERIDGRLKPLHFLSNSIKRLQIGRVKDEKLNLNSKNVVWLLVFCPCLKSASLGFDVSILDFNFLLFHQPSFAGLSNVVELSLNCYFVHKGSDEGWWSSKIEASKGWVGGSRKGFALFQIFSVTKHLTSFELCNKSREEEDMWTGAECLAGLQGSLQHLRLITLPFDVRQESKFKFSFHHLKVISLDLLALASLVNAWHLSLPDSLETIIMLHHSPEMLQFNGTEIQEEMLLNEVLNSSRPFPNLKEVLVPLHPIDSEAKIVDSAAFRLVWEKNRAELKTSRIFKSGKVELKTFKAGEIRE